MRTDIWRTSGGRWRLASEISFLGAEAFQTAALKSVRPSARVPWVGDQVDEPVGRAVREVSGLRLALLPTAVGDCTVTRAGHRAKVAQPRLTRRSAVVHWHIPLGVVQIHLRADTGPEGEDIGDLPDSDRRPESLRHLIAVNRRYLGRIQHGLYSHLAPRTAQKLHQLLKRHRSTLLGPDHRVTSTQSRLRRWKWSTTRGRAAAASNAGGTAIDND